MIKNNFFLVFLSFLLFFIAPCNATQSELGVIFKCQADAPKPIEIVVSKMNGTFKLETFNVEGTNLTNSIRLNDVTKSSYHRFLVTEHSMTFTQANGGVVVSDYYSEEFDMVTEERSVTIQKNGKKDYWTCDDSSFSKLSAIDDF
ncbi:MULTISPECIES: hypothetical protein [unclassified Pseudoalteromonas]|uniref:hypothetical protein n=1 Tax=unclassified Pseudoalteromonas TaxID=194690 RepID=UPI000464E4B9|nr:MULTISPECIES: hypothetical protein [unclassified Pseudoalteromonas]